MSIASVSTRPGFWSTAQAKLATSSSALFLLFAGSFLLHLVVALIFIRYPIALDDMYQYDMLARSIRDGRGYRWYSQADLDVLWPYYERMVEVERSHSPRGHTDRAPRAGVPAVFGAAVCFFPGCSTFCRGEGCSGWAGSGAGSSGGVVGSPGGISSPKVCLLAGIGVSLYPILMFYPVALASENLYVLLGLASLIAIYRLGEKRSLGGAALAGLLAGLTMLTRSVFAPFVLLAGLWLARFSPGQKESSARVLDHCFWFVPAVGCP